MSPVTVELVADRLRAILPSGEDLVGVCSLAVGADQLFAEIVIAQGHRLEVVLPSGNYLETFDRDADRHRYLSLLAAASEVSELPFPEPSEEAFFAAGKEVVLRSAELVAVWDGWPAGGLGGTGDIVKFAEEQGIDVTIVWPEGSSRT